MSAHEDSNTRAPVAVIGAGPVGCLVAKALSISGFRVHLYDVRKDPRFVDYNGSYRSINLALSARGIKALHSFDQSMTGRLLKYSVPLEARMIHLHDGRNSRQAYGLKGEHLYSTDRAVLNHALIDELRKAENVRILFEHKVISCDFDSLDLIFERPNGGRVSHKVAFVIGADGAYSKIRQQMMRFTRMDYSQTYIEDAYLELSMPAACSGNHAMDPGHLHIWPRHRFMLIALPNPDYTFTCTLFAPFEIFESLDTDTSVLLFFRSQFPDALPLIGETHLLHCFKEHPKSSLISIRCFPYHYADRALILGDAAHAMLPFYGQGLNCGFEDVHELFNIFQRHQVNPGLNVRANLGAAFAEYSNSRKASLDAIQSLAAANFVEMRSSVIRPLHLVRRSMDRALARLLGPSLWLPLYTMVTFRADLSYSEARRRGRLQDRIVEGAVWLSIVGLFVGLPWYRMRPT